MGLEVYKITNPQQIKGEDNKYNKDWREVVKIFLMPKKNSKEPDEMILQKYLRSFGKSIKERTQEGLTFFYVIKDKDTDEVFGFAKTKEQGTKYCYITYIAVKPTNKNKGIGKQLLSAITKRFTTVELSAIEGVYGFYKNCGYHAENILEKPEIMDEYGAEMFKTQPHRDDTSLLSHMTLRDVEKPKKSKDDNDKRIIKKLKK